MLNVFKALLLVLCALPAWAKLGAWPATVPPPASAVLVDTRTEALCTARTVAGARCLPAGEFTDAQGKLAPWREILWLFSTARLSGDETVLVLGDTSERRQFVGGLLQVAGQRNVRIVAQPPDALLSAGWPAAPGTPRDFARQMAYTAPMRDELLLFPHEYAPRRHWLAVGSLAAAPAGRLTVVTDDSPAQAVARWTDTQLRRQGQAALLMYTTGAGSPLAALFLLAAAAAGISAYLISRKHS